MTTVSVETQTEPIDNSKIHLRIPDPEGSRYCTTCKAWLPVEKFPGGPRRYCCKLHRWEKFGKQAKRKHMKNTENQLLFKLWVKAYSDSKLFKSVWDDAPTNQESSNTVALVNISQKEIKKLLQYMVKSVHVTSTMVELGKSTSIVPISPKELVSLSNAALVPSTVKRHLLKSFRSGGIEGYTRAMRVVEAQPNIVFRPSPEQLCEMRETLVSNSKTLLPEVE